MKIQRKILLLTGFLMLGMISWSQTGNEPQRIGEISFVSGSNYYVKLPAGNLLAAGDTLYMQLNGESIPALLVKQKSSLSCLAEKITERDLAKGEVIYAAAGKIGSAEVAQEPVVQPATLVQVVNKEEEKRDDVSVRDSLGTKVAGSSIDKKDKKDDFQLHGRIRAMGMLDLPTDSFAGRSSYRYSLFLKADNPGVHGLTLESYILFNHTNDVFSADTAQKAYGVKVYGLSAQYKGKQDYWITLGRKINNRLSNVGAIDGIQLEKKLGSFMLGVVYGFRPDYVNYSFNSTLPQFGGYISFEHGESKRHYQHSLAFVEQQNNGFTDRRFLYGQSSGRISSSVNYFASLELDLYKKVNGIASNSLTLTGLFFNLNWQATKNLSLSTSYQARQPIIFYETYQTYVDQLLDRELNQGYRLRASWRPWKIMTLSLSGGFRYEPGDKEVAQNYNGSLSLRNVPFRNVTTSLTATMNKSSYFTANIYGARMNGDIIPGKLSATLAYRNISYASSLESSIIPQHMVEVGLDYRLSKNWLLGLNYELLQQTSYPLNRLFLQIRYRF